MFRVFPLLFLCIAALDAHPQACECPPTSLTREECGKYDVIFLGEVERVKDCDDRPGEAVFRVKELFKGTIAESFTLVFRCEGSCARGFFRGDEWIIYTSYLQMNTGAMNWCSRSRKHFRNDKEDYYFVNYGVTFSDELTFLREKLGIHRVVDEHSNQAGKRNLLPGKRDAAVILLVSAAGLVFFYVLFRKFFK